MKTKVCTKCNKEKELFEFGKNSGHTDGFQSYCKNCSKKSRLIFYKKYPWKLTLISIKQRCENPKTEKYLSYGERGIECKITEEELEFLWNRDKAYEMDRPSIDRKNPNKNYELENCQFLELSINSGKDKNKPVLQFDLEGNFIKEWKSQTIASRKLKISQGNISTSCNNINYRTGDYKWKYKYEA